MGREVERMSCKFCYLDKEGNHEAGCTNHPSNQSGPKYNNELIKLRADLASMTEENTRLLDIIQADSEGIWLENKARADKYKSLLSLAVKGLEEIAARRDKSPYSKYLQSEDPDIARISEYQHKAHVGATNTCARIARRLLSKLSQGGEEKPHG